VLSADRVTAIEALTDLNVIGGYLRLRCLGNVGAESALDAHLTKVGASAKRTAIPLQRHLDSVRDLFLGRRIAAAELALARFASRLLWIDFLLALGEGSGLTFRGSFVLFESVLEHRMFLGQTLDLFSQFQNKCDKLFDTQPCYFLFAHVGERYAWESTISSRYGYLLMLPKKSRTYPNDHELPSASQSR